MPIFNVSRPRPSEFKSALAAWREACQEFRHHFAGSAETWPGTDGPGAANDRAMASAQGACNRLIELVLDVHDGYDGAAVAVDLGDKLLVVGPQPGDTMGAEAEDDPVLMVLDRSRIVWV
jgi:hypothetical protein